MSRKLFFASISVGIPTVNDVRHQHYCSLDTTTLPTSHTGYSRWIMENLKRATFNLIFFAWHFYYGKMCTYVIHKSILNTLQPQVGILLLADRLLWKIKRFMTYAILLRLCLKVVMDVINFTSQFNFGFRFWQIDIEQIVSPFLMGFFKIQTFEKSSKRINALYQTTCKVSDSITNYCRQSNFHPFPYIIKYTHWAKQKL